MKCVSQILSETTQDCYNIVQTKRPHTHAHTHTHTHNFSTVYLAVSVCTTACFSRLLCQALTPLCNIFISFYLSIYLSIYLAFYLSKGKFKRAIDHILKFENSNIKKVNWSVFHDCAQANSGF